MFACAAISSVFLFLCFTEGDVVQAMVISTQDEEPEHKPLLINNSDEDS